MKKPPDFYYRLWQMISNTTHVISKVRQRELNDESISMYSSGILDAVSRLGEKATPIAISKESSRERHSVSEQLSRMESGGLIRKVKDLHRKNLIRIELTEKGLKSFQRVNEQKSMKYIMTALTWEEQKELWALLAKVRERAIEYLGTNYTNVFPPSNIEEILTEGPNGESEP
jgi:DNA-binding MarR family transcriptional regulator